MLTGDKRETAMNIGHSCRLIKDYSSITVLDHETGEVSQRIAAATLNISNGHVAHSVVVVDGPSLSQISCSEPLHELFVSLAILVDTVICCRASPSQKYVFPDFILPLLHLVLSPKTWSGSIRYLDVFQGSLYSLRKAILTLRS